ncbi:MAG: hypothetical protein LBL17_00690 [Coxiellaceae bacterium]|jgi:guanine nucleotide exchange protein RalF|nr:hypothetical protein [Coxiellaceae bacterium]
MPIELHQALAAAVLDLVREFNNNPQGAIQKIKSECERLGISSDEQIAAFFHAQKKNLNLNKVGEYLAKLDNSNVLKLFVDGIEFKGKHFVDALGDYLESISPPGEAQIIDRLMNAFAESYSSQNPDVFPSEDSTKRKDAAFFLAFATVMLSTDLNNPSITKKMTLEEFQRQVSYDPSEVTLAPEFIQSIYTKALDRKMPKFMPTSPEYRLNSQDLVTNPTLDKLNAVLSSPTQNATFPGLEGVTLTVNTERRWWHAIIGYKATVTLKGSEAEAETKLQISQPGFFARLFGKKQPEIIIQPTNIQGHSPQASLQLASKVASMFNSGVTIEAAYEYMREDMNRFYYENKGDERGYRNPVKGKSMREITEALNENPVSVREVKSEASAESLPVSTVELPKQETEESELSELSTHHF